VLLPGGVIRQYSLCGDPEDRLTWRMAVLRDENGRGGSRYIHDEIREGEQILAKGPRNHFPLLPAARYHFIAGGIGITPLLPMMAQATRNGADWQLTYGGRTKKSMAFADELEQTYPGQVTYHPQDVCGLIDLDTLLARLQPSTEIYSCGPGPLLDALAERTADRPERLHVERFAPIQPAEPVERRGFDIELASSGRLLAVSSEESILDVLLDNDIYIDSSCEEGTCGSCETRVIAGDVDHRDAVLSAAERAKAASLMVCVSRAAATCPRLVLDL
jgi:ferredoxin-NADP reductase